MDRPTPGVSCRDALDFWPLPRSGGYSGGGSRDAPALGYVDCRAAMPPESIRAASNFKLRHYPRPDQPPARAPGAAPTARTPCDQRMDRPGRCQSIRQGCPWCVRVAGFMVGGDQSYFPVLNSKPATTMPALVAASTARRTSVFRNRHFPFGISPRPPVTDCLLTPRARAHDGPQPSLAQRPVGVADEYPQHRPRIEIFDES